MPSYQLSNWDTLTWIREKDNRFYRVFLRQDLWGNWIVTRAWGRIGTKRGGAKDLQISHQEAIGLIAKLGKKRRNRKYERINTKAN